VSDEQALVEVIQDAAVLSTFDPNEMLQRAVAQANVLHKLIEDRKLYKEINGRKHIYVEGWTTIGAFNGYVAATDVVEQGHNDKGVYYARAVARAKRTSDGVEVGSASGYCDQSEPKWSTRDKFAIQSMAQTRATSRLFREMFSWVAVLAGYDPTPEAEMPDDERGDASRPVNQNLGNQPPSGSAARSSQEKYRGGMWDLKLSQIAAGKDERAAKQRKAFFAVLRSDLELEYGDALKLLSEDADRPVASLKDDDYYSTLTAGELMKLLADIIEERKLVPPGSEAEFDKVASMFAGGKK